MARNNVIQLKCDRCGKFEQPMTTVERYVRDEEKRQLLNVCQPVDVEELPMAVDVVGSGKDVPVVLQPKPESRKTTKKPRGRNRGK